MTQQANGEDTKFRKSAEEKGQGLEIWGIDIIRTKRIQHMDLLSESADQMSALPPSLVSRSNLNVNRATATVRMGRGCAANSFDKQDTISIYHTSILY